MVLSILAIVFFLLVLISIVISTIRTGISPMPSSTQTRNHMIALIPTEPKYCIDLGSGWGGLLQLLSKRYPSSNIIGYELSWFPYLYAKWMFRKKTIEVYRKDYLSVSFPEDSVFLCYLCPSSMKRLSTKIPKKGWLISHTFALPNHNPVKTYVCDDAYRTHIYMYQL